MPVVQCVGASLGSLHRMVMDSKEISDHLDVASGMGLAASMFGVDLAPLMVRYSALTEQTTGPVRLITNELLHLLSVQRKRQGDEASRECFLELRHPVIANIAGKDSDAYTVEHWIGGDRTGDDLEVLREAGVSAAAIEELRECLACIDSTAQTAGWSIDAMTSTWTVYARLSGNQEHGQAAIDAIAERRSITEPQWRLAKAVHASLSRGRRTAIVALELSATELRPVLRLSYPQVANASVVQLIDGIFPDIQAASRLGRFAGVFSVEEVSVLELVLTDHEPVGLRLAFDVGGKS